MRFFSRYMCLSLAYACPAPISTLSASVNYGFPDATEGRRACEITRQHFSHTQSHRVRIQVHIPKLLSVNVSEKREGESATGANDSEAELWPVGESKNTTTGKQC